MSVGNILLTSHRLLAFPVQKQYIPAVLLLLGWGLPSLAIVEVGSDENDSDAIEVPVHINAIVLIVHLL